MNQYKFLKIYKDIAEGCVNPDDLTTLFWDLKYSIVNSNDSNNKFFTKAKPEKLTMALAIDYVAHQIHQGGNDVLQKFIPGADYSIVKEGLDSLAGLEKFSEVRKSNRGYFTSLFSDKNFIFLEKQQVGRTIKEDIKEAIKEYERLYVAQIASPAEILTLYRYYGPGSKYEKIVLERDLEEEDNEPLVVGGPASVAMVDREGHLITSAALEKAFSKFMKSFRTRNSNVFHCLTPEIMIWDAYGYCKPIKDIKEGDLVITHKERTGKVIQVFTHENNGKILHLTLDNGNIIKITEEHQVLTTGGWKKVKDLTVEDRLDSIIYVKTSSPPNPNYLKYIYGRQTTKIVDIKEDFYSGLVHNLEVEPDNSYAGVGIVYHNSDVQTGWVIPAYINKGGQVFKSGVDDKGLWVISEIRGDTRVAKRMAEEIQNGNIKSYSIAGSATDTEFITKGSQEFMQVNDLELAEITFALVPDTKICIAGGEKNIQEIEPNDYVITHRRRQCRVTHTHKIAYDGEIIELTMEDGRTLSLTPEHRVKVKEKGWVFPTDLMENDEIVEGTPNRRGKTIASGDLGAINHNKKRKGKTKKDYPNLSGGIKTESGKAIQRAAVTSPEFCQMRSRIQKEKSKDPEYIDKVLRKGGKMAWERKTPEEKISHIKKMFMSARYERNSGCMSKAEISMQKLLESVRLKNWKFNGDFTGLTISGKSPDFWDGNKKVIELYGDYWHNGQNPQDRIDLFKQSGYECLIIWEHELKNDPICVLEKIIDFSWDLTGVPNG